RIRTQSQLVRDASSQSVVSTMERFMKAVNEMNDHVILPTKLLDQEESPSDNVPVMLRGSHTRYDFYQCINTIKKDLVLGVSSNDEDIEGDSPPDSGRASPRKNSKSPTRRHSTTLLANPRPPTSENLPQRKTSLQDNSAAVISFERQDSWASLNPLPEYHNQVSYDSGEELEEEICDVMSPVEIAEKLKEHLQGLQIGLNHLTKTAKYITNSIK
ncbi:unnamed protein product, partial [Meganyctiphanes norvegica]